MIDFQPKNLIVRMPNWIGDLVMALPVLTNLKKNFPEAKITALVKSSIGPVLQHFSDIDEIIFFEKGDKLLAKKLQSKNFDLAILLTNSFSSAYLFYKAKIKNIVGFKNELRSFFLDFKIKRSKESYNQHLVLTYLELLKPLNCKIFSTKPHLVITTEEVKHAKKLLEELKISNKTIIGLNPGAAFGEAKCWPMSRYKEVAKKLLQDPNNGVIVFGDNKQRDLIDECFKDVPEIINLSGKTGLRELMALISLCDVFLTNDSGPMHIAAALNIPLVAIFGSTSEVLTGPCSDSAIVINKKVKCSPCFKRKCPIDFKCMNNIHVDEVLKKIELMKHAKKNSEKI
ncbi:MAG: lipopolysaccharide heptosyltransferase II [Chlamydiae bacterium]|nr:lipopolysaccharide heptosyltransferase II [Chlamydiota bacterium]